MTVRLYQATDKLVLSVLTVFYIGMFLPSLAIGYNQYACIRYGRQYYYSHAPYNGIFYIKDISGEKQGLRDRYGILVEPEYDGIYHPDGNGGLVEIELRKTVIPNIMTLGLMKSEKMMTSMTIYKLKYARILMHL